ncbi:MAG: MFS transporter [Thermocrispum sp.]
MPFYPVYAVLFAETGLSTAQISTLFVIWAAVTMVAEVPSGALADLVPRHRLLVASAVVYAGTFAAWMAFPSFAAFAVGFVLWGVSSALGSGTFEAYTYDTLARHGAVRRYPRLVARARAGGLTLNLLATLLASPLLALGGFTLVGWASVGTCVVQALLACTLPPDRRPPTRAPEEPGYVAVLRAGVGEARRVVAVRHAVLIAALIPGFLAFDEYFPLLAVDLDAATTTIPLLIAATVAAQAVGALLGERCAPGLVPAALVGAAVLLTAGSLSGRPAGFVGLAAGYGLMQMTIVVAEVRLQAVITGRARATVTSVAGLLSELFAITVFAGFALGAAWLSLVGLVCLLAAGLVPLAWLARRWLPG